MKRRGLTAGGGMILGMIFGLAMGHLVVGMVIGLLLGLGIALGVAIYLNRVPDVFVARSKQAEPAQGARQEGGKLALSTGPVFDPAGKRIGIYTSIWRREPSGEWKIIFDRGCPVCDCAAQSPAASSQ